MLGPFGTDVIVLPLPDPPKIEIDERGFWLVNGQRVPDTEIGRVYFQTMLREYMLSR